MTSSFLAGPDATDPSAVNPLGSEPLVGNPNDRKDETILGSPTVHDQVGSNPLPPGETPVELPNYNFAPAAAPLGPIGAIGATAAIASEKPPISNYESGGGGGGLLVAGLPAALLGTTGVVPIDGRNGAAAGLVAGNPEATGIAPVAAGLVTTVATETVPTEATNSPPSISITPAPTPTEVTNDQLRARADSKSVTGILAGAVSMG